MATIETRINETTGEEEIIIKDINNDLNGLIDEINKCREEEKQEIKTRKIFITEDIIFNDKFSDNIEIYNCVFEKKVDFSNSVFRKKVKLYKCIFESTTHFNNTTFKNLVDFYGCVFKKPQQFYKTDFNRVTIFSNAIFEQEAQFIYCTTTLLSYISFQSAKFKMGIDVARANFNCKVNFWDIRVEDEELLEAINSDYYFSDFNLKWLDENRNNKKELDKWTPASKKLRESMRFIKNNFYAENNQIEGLEFYKKEMNIYREEIKYPTNKKENTSNPKKMNKYIEIFSKFHPIFQAIISIFTIIVVASPYLLTQSYIWFYILILPFFAGILYIPYTQNKNNINSTIKEGNYIPFILFFTFLIMNIVAIYGINDYKNDFFYILINKLKNFLYELLKNEDILKSIPTFLFVFISFIFLFLFDFRDKVLLFLNKISNNFGTNWMAGVNFTIFIGLFTLLPIVWVIYFKYNYILYFDPSLKGIGNFLYNFGQIINITEWSDIKIYGEEITGWSYVWLFIGRIFIGYGYYQTIQAFRKYGKS